MRAVVFLLVLVLSTSWAKPVLVRDPMINPDLFEGDMIVERGEDRNAVPLDSQRWPGGVIVYVFDFGVDPFTKQLLEQTMDHLTKYTCLKFVKRTTERDYIKVFEGNGCYSAWGRIGGEQPMSLERDGCQYFGTIMHELLHAVGFEHEHTRSDRDNYLIINWPNIDPEFYGQFTKRQPFEERRLTPFDFDSVMLYPSSAFAKSEDVKSLEAIDGREIIDVRVKKYPAASDLKRINMLYKCNV